MRRIFVSYSRKNLTWVELFAEKLREQGGYDVWFDKRIPGGSPWWEKIIDEINDCEVFIHVGTKFSYGSIYCRSELKYSFELNKPIIPIFLHPGIRPKPREEEKKQNERAVEDDMIAIIREKIWGEASEDAERFLAEKQAKTLYEEDDFDTVILFHMERSICDLKIGKAKGRYSRPKLEPERPPLPMPDPDEAAELANEHFNNGNYAEAVNLFKYALKKDKLDEELKNFYEDRLKQSVSKVRMIKEYVQIEIQVGNYDIEYARTLWKVFKRKYHNHVNSQENYDPRRIEDQIRNADMELTENPGLSYRLKYSEDLDDDSEE